MLAPSEKRLFEIKRDTPDKTAVHVLAQTVTTYGYRLVILGSIIEVLFLIVATLVKCAVL